MRELRRRRAQGKVAQDTTGCYSSPSRRPWETPSTLEITLDVSKMNSTQLLITYNLPVGVIQGPQAPSIHRKTCTKSMAARLTAPEPRWSHTVRLVPTTESVTGLEPWLAVKGTCCSCKGSIPGTTLQFKPSVTPVPRVPMPFSGHGRYQAPTWFIDIYSGKTYA